MAVLVKKMSENYLNNKEKRVISTVDLTILNSILLLSSVGYKVTINLLVRLLGINYFTVRYIVVEKFKKIGLVDIKNDTANPRKQIIIPRHHIVFIADQSTAIFIFPHIAVPLILPGKYFPEEKVYSVIPFEQFENKDLLRIARTIANSQEELEKFLDLLLQDTYRTLDVKKELQGEQSV